MDARKEKLDSTVVWERIKTAQSIHVAKGKKVDVFDPNVDTQDDILKAIMDEAAICVHPRCRSEIHFSSGSTRRYMTRFQRGERCVPLTHEEVDFNEIKCARNNCIIRPT